MEGYRWLPPALDLSWLKLSAGQRARSRTSAVMRGMTFPATQEPAWSAAALLFELLDEQRKRGWPTEQNNPVRLFHKGV